MSVLCPLCTQASFGSIDALRASLIKAANGPLPCPICHESFLGLDKLTIHLFSHTNLITNNLAATTTTTPATPAAATNGRAPTQCTAPHEARCVAALGVALPPNSVELPSMTQQSSSQLAAATCRERASKKSKQAAQSQLGAATTSTLPAASSAATSAAQRASTATGSGSGAYAAALATCDVCEFTFRNVQLRDMHFRLVHQNTTGPAEANAFTGAAAKQSGAAEHEFKCHLCAKTFKMKGSLRVHLKVVHLMGAAAQEGAHRPSISDRIRKRADGGGGGGSAEAPPPTLATVMPAGATFSIGTLTLVPSGGGGGCGGGGSTGSDCSNSNVLLVFNATPSVAADHPIKQEAAYSSNHKGIVATGTNSDANPKIWECDVCTKAFTTKYFLKKHKRLHTGEMPYTCELCGRTFTFQQSYHKHLLYHNDEKPHVCATCGRAFKELSTLHNHERIHSGEKPFKCEVCGKSFRQRVSFLVHTRIHTGVMPYKCELCQKRFRYKVSQRTHKCATKCATPEPTNEHPQATAEAAADHMSDSFIKAFLESNAIAQMCDSEQQSPASHEIAHITATNQANTTSMDEHEALLLSQTIDDIVVESCNKMGIGDSLAMQHPHPQQHNGYVPDGSNSPSEKLQNMRLYSPQQLIADMTANIDGNTEFPHFLLDDDVHANML